MRPSYWAQVAMVAWGSWLVWTAWFLGPIPHPTPLQKESCSSDPNEQTPPVEVGAVLGGDLQQTSNLLWVWTNYLFKFVFLFIYLFFMLLFSWITVWSFLPLPFVLSRVICVFMLFAYPTLNLTTSLEDYLCNLVNCLAAFFVLSSLCPNWCCIFFVVFCTSSQYVLWL